MKYLRVIIVLLMIAGPVLAEKSANIVELTDFDSSLEGFSFSRGGLVAMSSEAGGVPIEIDFIFDMPHGLGMNNTALDSFFSGDAMVKDLGPVPLEEDSDLSDEGFTIFLEPEQIITGHSYLIKTTIEGIYGKIRIIGFDPENGRLKIEWVLE